MNHLNSLYNRITTEESLRQVGINVTNPNPTEADLYIGSLVLHSSGIIQALTDELGLEKVMSAHGYAVLPLTNRRALSGATDAHNAVESALDAVYAYESRFLGIPVLGTHINTKRGGRSVRLNLDETAEPMRVIYGQISNIHNVFTRYIGPRKQGHKPTLRLVSTENVAEMEKARNIIDSFGIERVVLTPPVICGVAKK